MEVLRLPGLVEARLVERKNRFLARVDVRGKTVSAHVHDPGRLKELIYPGARLLLLPRKGRKTDYHVVAAWREGHGWVFIHSGYHRRIVETLIEAQALPEFRGLRGYAAEVPVEGHRIDFGLVYDSGVVLMETKGCTLFRDDLALFPDAPTERGRKHVGILAKHTPSILLFLAMSKNVSALAPNEETDPRFADALRFAALTGVHVTALRFSFDGEILSLAGRLPVILREAGRELLRRAERAARAYNKRFSPEANAVPTAADEGRVWVLFHGFMCVSCGLRDYFEDFADLLGLPLIAYHQIGTAYVAAFGQG